MINQFLHREPVGLDSNQHRQLKMKLPVTDWSVASRLNSMFLAAVEFADACREFPIVFVRVPGDDGDGKPQIAPVAVFGLEKEQNLFLDGGRWRGNYMPACLRMYPFGIARVDEQRFAICFDRSWSGVGEGEGQPLFDADGKPTALTTSVQQQLEQLEREVQRTRALGRRLLELELLRDMRFDATLADGRKVAVEGFQMIEESKLNALSDAQVLELQRNGVLGLIHAHLISMGNMRKLADWHAQQGLAQKAAADAAADPAPPAAA